MSKSKELLHYLDGLNALPVRRGKHEGCLDSIHHCAFRVMEDNIFKHYLSSILDREEIKLFLHAEVVEGQIDSALRVGDDQPHTVHIITVLLRVVWRQEHARWSGKVEETGN